MDTPTVTALSLSERIKKGEITATDAVSIYEEQYLERPSVRPEWGSKMKGVAEPKTDYQKEYNELLRQEARKAMQGETGKVIDKLSQPVSAYKTFVDNEASKKGTSYSKLYGDDFIRQVEDKDLNSLQRVWKQVAQQFYGRDVFYVDYNQKVKDDMASPLHLKKGARMTGSGAIVIVKGDPIRNTGTIFHELTHDMNRTSPELWGELTKFMRDNIDNEAIRDEASNLAIHYGTNKDALTDELVAGFVGDIMKQEPAQVALLNKLRLQDPTTFNKLIRYIRQALQKLSNFLRNSDQKEMRLIAKDVDKAIDFVTNTLAKYQPTAVKGPVAKTQAEMVKAVKADVPVFDIQEKGRKEVKYYSQMNKYLAKVLPGKGGGKQYSALIKKWQEKGEFKAEEMEWAGVMDWLGKQEGVINQKDIMDYLKENEVSIVEVHKKEAKEIDFDVPEAVDMRMRLIVKIQHSMEGNPLTLNRDPDGSYSSFTIDTTDEVIPFDNTVNTLISMGASERYAENVFSDIKDLVELNDNINEAQSIMDPQTGIRKY